jgi:EmrB/QacA subfamily drug resistance transporter
MQRPQSSIYKWIVLATVSLANFSAALDMSIIVVSFPRLVAVFQTEASVVIWLIIAFSIAELGLVLTLAKVGDTVGRKKVYIAGLVFYTVGLIFCTVSQNIGQLILSRVVQGAGAAMALTVGGAIVIAVFPHNQQGRAIGIFGMLMSAGLIAGPALGGVILDFLDWQGIFYTRIPIGIICLALALIIIKEQKESDAPLQLDWGGAVTLLIGTSCLLLYLNLGKDWGYFSGRGLAFGLSAVVLLGLFFNFERKAAQPVLNLGFFKNRVFTMANTANFLHMMTGVACPTMLPFLLISGLLFSPSKVGILNALIAIPPVFLSPISGWLSDKIGNRPLMIIGTLCFASALFGCARFGLDSSTLQIALTLLLFGCGMGLFTAPDQSAIVGAVPRKYLSSAVGVATTIRLLGASVGATVVGTLYAARFVISRTRLYAQGVDVDLLERLAVVESYRYVLLFAACISVLPILASIATGGRKTREDCLPDPSLSASE